MGLINQWEAVTSLDCNQIGNATCFKTGIDVLNYYGFKQVRSMTESCAKPYSLVFRAISIAIWDCCFFCLALFDCSAS
jgi:hypothetical protein